MSTIKGKLIKVLTLESGVSKAGKEWKKQSIVIEYQDGNFTKTVCIQIGSSAIEHIPAIGTEIEVSYSLESREWNDKWYSDIKGWKIVAQGASNPVPAKLEDQGGNDQLPF